jgi:hypothetical protein
MNSNSQSTIHIPFIDQKNTPNLTSDRIQLMYFNRDMCSYIDTVFYKKSFQEIMAILYNLD